MLLSFITSEAAAAVTSVTPNTWNVIGLDSNTPASGPNSFPVGARVCGSTSTNIAVSLAWDTGGTDDVTQYIHLRPGSAGSGAPAPALTVLTDSVTGCADAYFEVEVTKDSAAHDKTRRFHITATDGNSVSTPIQELYVEKLVSQGRNAITNMRYGTVKTSLTSVAAGGSFDLQVGSTYWIEMVGYTATQGYEQLESFINLSNTVFQVLSVETSYSANTSTSVANPNPKLYGDGCTWDSEFNSPNYRSCTGEGKVGGNITVLYQIKILSVGSGSVQLTSLIHDFSGSSYHYNSDYSTTARTAYVSDPTLITIAKSFSPVKVMATEPSTLKFTITNPNYGTVSGVSFADDFPNVSGSYLAVNTTPSYTATGCGSLTTSPNPIASGNTSISFSNISILGNSTCVISLLVAPPVNGSYVNSTKDFKVGTTNLSNASATLTAANDAYTPPTPPSTCPSPLTLANWTVPSTTDPPDTTGGSPSTAGWPTTILGDVTTARASYTGTGTSSIVTAPTGGTTNVWKVLSGWPSTAYTDLTTAPSPYYQFTVDSTNYGGIGIAFNYLIDGNWAAKANNHIYIWSSRDGINFTNILDTNNIVKSDWYSASATASGSYSTTTTFRIAFVGQQNTSAYTILDNISITGCKVPAPPTITKSFSPTTIAANGTSTLTLGITNPTSGVTLNGVAFTDTLPEGLTVATSGPTTVCGGTLNTTAPSTITFTGGVMSTTTTCNITVTVTGTTQGLKNNVSGRISATESGENKTTNGFATAAITVIAPPVLVKSFSPSTIYTSGTTTTSKLSFSITNPNLLSTSSLASINFTDNLPSGVTVVTSGPTTTCSGSLSTTSPSTVSFSGGSLAANSSCTLPDITVTGTTAGTKVNTTSAISSTHTASSTTVNGSTATATLLVIQKTSSISLNKQISTSSSGPWSKKVAAVPGATVYYRFNVYNSGDLNLGTIAITDNSSPSLTLTCQPDATQIPPVTCPPTLIPGADVYYISNGFTTSSTPGSYVNTATSSGYDGSATVTSTNSTATYQTISATITKASSQAAFKAAGDVLTYTYTVANNGFATLSTPLTVSDDKTTVTCNAFSTAVKTSDLSASDGDSFLDPGEQITCSSAYTVLTADVAARKVTNIASATVNGFTTTTATKTVPLAADLTATKSNNFAANPRSNVFTWTISVANLASSGSTATFAAGKTILVDNLPSSGASFVLGTITTAGVTGAANISCTIDGSKNLTCTANGGSVALLPGLTGTVATDGTATLAGTGTKFLTELSDGSIIIIAGVPYTVVSRASDTSLTLDRAYAGGTAGPLTIDSAITIPITVTAATIGSLVNPRTGVGMKCQADPDAAPAIPIEISTANNACADTLTLPAPLIAILKNASTGNAKPDDVIEYTVNINNSGTGYAKDVYLSDDLSPYTLFGINNYGAGVTFDTTAAANAASELTMGTPYYNNDVAKTSLTDRGDGYDDTVTSWKIPMDGYLKPGGTYTLKYKVKIK